MPALHADPALGVIGIPRFRKIVSTIHTPTFARGASVVTTGQREDLRLLDAEVSTARGFATWVARAMG